MDDFWELVGSIALFVLLAFVLALMYGVAVGYTHLTSARTNYVQQCTIANKELPRPDLYCDALWQQTQSGNGGR